MAGRHDGLHHLDEPVLYVGIDLEGEVVRVPDTEITAGAGPETCRLDLWVHGRIVQLGSVGVQEGESCCVMTCTQVLPFHLVEIIEDVLVGHDAVIGDLAGNAEGFGQLDIDQGDLTGVAVGARMVVGFGDTIAGRHIGEEVDLNGPKRRLAQFVGIGNGEFLVFECQLEHGGYLTALFGLLVLFGDNSLSLGQHRGGVIAHGGKN